MIIDYEITLTFDLQTDARMTRDLVEHMIKKTNSGFHADRVGLVQIHGHANLRFLGFAFHFGFTIREQKFIGDLLPTQAITKRGADAKAPDPHISSEFHIGIAISDHGRSLPVPIGALKPGKDHSHAWLAAFTG